jgi:hypothetical protein
LSVRSLLKVLSLNTKMCAYGDLISLEANQSFFFSSSKILATLVDRVELSHNVYKFKDQVRLSQQYVLDDHMKHIVFN